MIRLSKKLNYLLAAAAAFCFAPSQANAHPHVFVEASIEIVRNNAGEFSELRQVWRFDEIFSSTLVLDFDANTDGVLDKSEIKTITNIVKESISEYDYYTALRAGTKGIDFYKPDELNAYMEDGQIIMFLSIEPTKNHSFKDAPLRVSASDTSYYVAFEMKYENVTIHGPNPEECTIDVTHPNFDALYAENSQTLSDAFYNEGDENPDLDLGDEFYSWAEIKCS